MKSSLVELNSIKMITPTYEQEEIIKSLPNHKVLKINAFAGTGKTSTLQMLTNHYATKRFLYLAYNKSIQLEAESKFGKNVEVKTVHALAYKYVISHTKLDLKKIINYNPKNISKIFNLDYKEAKNILSAFNQYCNSDKVDIGSNEAYSNYIKEIVNKIENKKLDISFDFILKKFHLLLVSGIETSSFDTVMLDEAQDSNDVTLDIFNRLNSKHKVLVGDKHQQIYSFRESINAMAKIEGKELALTKTFRFPNNIAMYSNILLERFKGEKLKIQSDKKEVDFNTVYNDDSRNVGYISRGNATLIATMQELSLNKNNYKTVRHPKEIFMTIKDIGYFLDEKRDEISIQNSFLKQLKNKEDLENYITATKDYQLEMNLRICGTLFNFCIQSVLKLENEAIEYYNSNEQFRYFLTTAHTAKGLEFDCIIVADDFFGFANVICKMKYKTYEEFIKKIIENNDRLMDEFNLFYVAITRCKLSAIIHDNNLKYILEENWKEAVNLELEKLAKLKGCE